VQDIVLRFHSSYICCNYEKHGRNLVNNSGAKRVGVNRPWVLGTLIYEGVSLERARRSV